MQWYFSKDSAQHGPVTLQDLQAKIQSGDVAMDALVWRDGMADWAPANTVAEIGPVAPVDGGAAVSVYAPPASPAPAVYPPIVNARPTSGLAIASLILGILGLTTCTFFTGIPAVICGHLAMGRTHPQTGNLGGRSMAVAGLITGYVCSAVIAIFIIFYLLVIVGLIASSASY